MQEIPTDLEYYIELFLDAITGREIKTNQIIANHFEAQSERFLNRHTKENSSQVLKTDTLNEFVRRLIEAIEYIKSPFLERITRNEHMIYSAMDRGLDTTNYVRLDLKTSHLRLEDIYKPLLERKRYTGNLEYSKLESVVKGFELFREQTVSPPPTPPPSPAKGIYLGYSVEQLTSLHVALIEKGYLKDNAPLKHFINAFNGEELEKDFKPLEWKSKTMGAIFINYFLRNSETQWKDTQHILESANYKQLLSQILKQNKFSDCTNKLSIIEKQIKLMTIIDSQ